MHTQIFKLYVKQYEDPVFHNLYINKQPKQEKNIVRNRSLFCVSNL